MQLGVHAAVHPPYLAPLPPFFTQGSTPCTSRRCSAHAAGQGGRLQRRRVDHDRLVLGNSGGEADHDPSEGPVVAPAFPTVVESLRRTVFLQRITTAQAIAIDEDYATENPTAIDAEFAMAVGAERLSARHPDIRQPLKIAHRIGHLTGLNHAKYLK